MPITPEEEEWAGSVAAQIHANPKLFRECYPDLYAQIKENNIQAMADEPMAYVVLLRDFWEGLHGWFVDATDSNLPPSMRRRKLSELQKSLETLLHPPHPFPSIVQQGVTEYSADFTEYLDRITAALVPGDVASEQPGPATTNRERILIHCYEEGMPIARGHRDYNDYIQFATPRKRVAYPNESLSKLKSLIKSIDAILPFLSEKARKQADNELDTLRLQNQ